MNKHLFWFRLIIEYRRRVVNKKIDIHIVTPTNPLYSMHAPHTERTIETGVLPFYNI